MKEFKNISLKEVGKEKPFSLPENYFEQFATKIAVQTDTPSKSKKMTFKRWMYVAAAFIGVLLVGNVLLSTYKQNQSDEMESYELFILSQVDEYGLLEYYLDDYLVN